MDITSLSHQELLQLARTNVAAFANNSTWYEANEAQYLQNLYDIATKGSYPDQLPWAAYDLLGGYACPVRSDGLQDPIAALQANLHPHATD